MFEMRLDNRKQDVINKRITEDIVLDIGDGERLIGLEIMDASRHVSLDRILPVNYETAKAS